MTAAIPKHNVRAALASQTQVLKQNLQTPIPAPRIALERKINLRFPHFQGFLTESSANISITGMFIRARFPQRPGTIVDFEFNLHDGLNLIRGTGEVVWVRRKDEADLPSGMGIRFLRLDAASRRLIRWAVEKQIDDGGLPFDLEASLATADAPEAAGNPRPEAPKPWLAGLAAGGQADKLHPYAGYGVARRAWPSRWLPATAAGALVIAVMVAAASLRQSGSAGDAAGPAPGTPEHSAAVASQPPPEALAGTPSVEEKLIQTTEAWARAWGEQRAEDYLSFYSGRFLPPGALSRGDWEAQRRARIRQPDFIQVGISNLEAEVLSSEHARLTFDQTYRSDHYRDATRKTLDLVLEDGSWKILAEQSA